MAALLASIAYTSASKQPLSGALYGVCHGVLYGVRIVYLLPLYKP